MIKGSLDACHHPPPALTSLQIYTTHASYWIQLENKSFKSLLFLNYVPPRAIPSRTVPYPTISSFHFTDKKKELKNFSNGVLLQMKFNLLQSFPISNLSQQLKLDLELEKKKRNLLNE